MTDARGIIGNYIVEHELGRGGMGIVYAARHRVLGHRAAIKVLLSVADGDHARIERFYNEARAAMAIRHPNVVTIHDVGLDAHGRPYIAMELLDGTSLAQHLTAGPLPVRVAVDYAIQIADALGAAHAASVIHRDLKPENIIVASDRSRVTLVDFGVAKLSHAATVRTATGALIGTPLYMSPEQCEGLRELDARSDLYSLGCVLFAMVAGRPPFDAPSPGALIGMHQHVAPPLLRTRVPACSEALERLVAILLAKQPTERFRTAAAVRAALDAPEVKGLAGAMGVAATADVVPMPAAGSPARLASTATPLPPVAFPAAPPPPPAPARLAPTLTPTVPLAPPPRAEPPAPAPRSRRWLAVVAAGVVGLGVAVVLAARGCGGHSTPTVAVAPPGDATADSEVLVVGSAADATIAPEPTLRPLTVNGVPEAFLRVGPADAGVDVPDAALAGGRPPDAGRRAPAPDAAPRAVPDAARPPDAAPPAVAPPDAARPDPAPSDAAARPRVALREHIEFATNDFGIGGAGDVIARVADAYAPGSVVRIVGHAEQNESQRPEGIASARANSVLTALVNRRVPRDAIEVDREVHPPTANGAGRRVDIRVE